jgi:hypothetical protein
MNHNCKNILTYYLNPDGFNERTQNLFNIFNNLELKNTIKIVSNPQPICKANNTTNAHIKVLNTAIENNAYPFLILEDDIKSIKTFSFDFDIPKECDIVYLGASLHNHESIKPNFYLTQYNDFFYRVYYVFTTHAIIINNKNFAIHYRNMCINSLKNCNPNDVDLSLSSKDYIALTPKNGPYFCQDGYNEELTRFLWSDYSHFITC